MKVIFHKQIHSSCSSFSTNDVILIAEVDLPFVPFIGMKITNEKWLEDTVEDIYWDLDLNAFRVYMPSDNEIYEAQLHQKSHRSLQEIVNEYLAYDFWKVKEYKRKDDNNDITTT